jgi:hypothetical protein
MKITLICEARSGSTNLAKWFNTNKDFTVLFEPITNSKLRCYKGDIPPNKWEYKTKHLLTKEVFNLTCNFTELINFSDKVIILHRENKKEQIESWINAEITNNWSYKWAFTGNRIIPNEKLLNNIKEIMEKFNEFYIKNNEFFTVTYEELYYGTGFQRIVNYLDIDEVKNENFPFGQKYRIDVKGKQNLI